MRTARHYDVTNATIIIMPGLAISPDYYAPRPEELLPAGAVSDKVAQEIEKPVPLLLQSTTVPSGNKTITLKNRAMVSPMCMYSSRDGFPTPFHLVHYGQFALHGAGAIVVEASGVTPEGRISDRDMGMYKEEHVDAHASLVSTVKSLAAGVKIGIQLAHAGRKASTWAMYDQRAWTEPFLSTSEGGWEDSVLAPSAIPFGEGHIMPKEMTLQQIRDVEDDFVRAADRAFRAGYDFVMIHSAHGYLISSFNSPLTNKRTDEYGGSFENRTRLLRNIVHRIRSQFPDKGVWVRLNGTDGVEDGKEESWTDESTRALAPLLEQNGVDVLDISSRGTVRYAKVKMTPGYQVPAAIAAKSSGLKRMLVSAVGSMHGGTQEEPDKYGLFAEKSLQEGSVDLVSLGRVMLHNPSWVKDAAQNLMGADVVCALQYGYTLPSLRRRL